ncbi:MAG: 4-hydroxy-3-methylbut-2-enyl diphosphate reductase [Candidatus Omnitrophica bacterium]|nr:4-hydroxy-3-methylbut-2-enyl diphosphate reductase [Candidatus Omnitrophota bacterium]
MKINLAKSAGFCFGVKRALKIALETATVGKEICMLGDIVHNEDVVKQISKAGVKKIGRLCQGKEKILLIRAHGASLSTINKAKKLGYEIVDATCLMVKEIHKIAQNMEKKGYRIIVIGDKKHDEVMGIVGQLNSKAIVIDGLESIPPTIKKIKKACVVSQSTQNIKKVNQIVDALKLQIKNLKFFNTICVPTKLKQEEIKLMPLQNDVMIIIGSRKSANTRRLYEISKSLNQNSYWINSSKEIKRSWFNGKNSVGVTAGASTPDTTTKKIIEYLRKIG